MPVPKTPVRTSGRRWSPSRWHEEYPGNCSAKATFESICANLSNCQRANIEKTISDSKDIADTNVADDILHNLEEKVFSYCSNTLMINLANRIQLLDSDRKQQTTEAFAALSSPSMFSGPSETLSRMIKHITREPSESKISPYKALSPDLILIQLLAKTF